MNKKLCFLWLTIAVVIFVCGCNSVRSDFSSALANLRNDEVDWQGTIAGLQPIVRGKNARTLLLAQNKSIDSLLIERIDDRHQFAATHVLLTLRLKLNRLTSGEQWNSLHVKLRADGGVLIDPSQRSDLKKQWIDWLKGGVAH